MIRITIETDDADLAADVREYAHQQAAKTAALRSTTEVVSPEFTQHTEPSR